MNKLLPIIFSVLLVRAAFPAPPEPAQPSEFPELLMRSEAEDSIMDALMVSAESLQATLPNKEFLKQQLQDKIFILEERYKGLGNILKELDKGLELKELTLEGDSVVIVLDNDSIFSFSYDPSEPAYKIKTDKVHFAGKLVIGENETIEGDVVSAFGDIIVKGTVEGGVFAMSGDIYVASTGYIEGTAAAFSGKIKLEPGARVEGPTMDGKKRISYNTIDDRGPFRIMATVFLILFFIWIVLSATAASLLKKNINCLIESIRINPWRSFFKGYLVFALTPLAFIALCITILGIPLALLALPLMVIGAMVLAGTAVSIIVGSKILHTDDMSFKTFIYGSLALGTSPFLFFLFQLLTGSMVLMVFSWIIIAIFIFLVLPIGLGAVLSTRFGTRPDLAIACQPGRNSTSDCCP